MRKLNLALTIGLITFPVLYAGNRVINQPDYEICSNIKLSVDCVELTDSVTIFDMSFYGEPGYEIKLAPTTYLKGKNSDKEYKLVKCEGLDPGEGIIIPDSGLISSKLCFPSIAEVDLSVDFIEPEGWEIHGLKLYDDTASKIETHISGTSEIPGNGFMLIMEAGDDPRVNKSYMVPVRGGKFNYTVYTEEPRLLATYPGILMINGTMNPGYFWSEGGNIKIDYKNDPQLRPQVEGGVFTTAINDYYKASNLMSDSIFYGNEICRKYHEMEESGTLFSPEANELHHKLNLIPYGRQREEIQEEINKLWEEDRIYSPEGKKVNEAFNNYMINNFDSIDNSRLNFIKESFRNPSLVGLGEIYHNIKFDWRSDELLRFYEDNYSEFMSEHPYSKFLTKLSNETNPIPGNHYIDFTAPDLNGEMVTISDVIHNKVALIDLWASWCGPCRQKSVALIPVYEKYKAKRFEIIGIARENGDTKAMEKAIGKDGYPWLNLVDLNDKSGIWVKYRAGLSGGKQILVDENGMIISVDPTSEEVEAYLQSRME